MCVSCDHTLSRLFCRALSLSVVSVVVVCSVSSSLVICYIYVIRGILLRAKWLHLSCLPSMSRPPAATPRSCPSRFQPPSSLPPRGAALTPQPRPASPRFQPSVRSPPSLRPRDLLLLAFSHPLIRRPRRDMLLLAFSHPLVRRLPLPLPVAPIAFSDALSLLLVRRLVPRLSLPLDGLDRFVFSSLHWCRLLVLCPLFPVAFSILFFFCSLFAACHCPTFFTCTDFLPVSSHHRLLHNSSIWHVSRACTSALPRCSSNCFRPTPCCTVVFCFRFS